MRRTKRCLAAELQALQEADQILAKESRSLLGNIRRIARRLMGSEQDRQAIARAILLQRKRRRYHVKLRRLRWIEFTQRARP